MSLLVKLDAQNKTAWESFDSLNPLILLHSVVKALEVGWTLAHHAFEGIEKLLKFLVGRDLHQVSVSFVSQKPCSELHQKVGVMEWLSSSNCLNGLLNCQKCVDEVIDQLTHVKVGADSKLLKVGAFEDIKATGKLL